MAEVKPDKSERKRVTLREVAQEAGVSLKSQRRTSSTIPAAWPDTTREKGCRTSSTGSATASTCRARNLNRGKTGFITLAVPSLTAP